MNVLVLASNGRVSSLVIEQLIARGHQVTGVSRSANKNPKLNGFIEKDILALTAEDMLGYDAIVNGFGVWKAEEYALHIQIIQHLNTILADNTTPLYIVGGCGSLYIDQEKQTKLFQSPDFPKEYVALCDAEDQSLQLLQQNKIHWIYISPALFFDADGVQSKQVIISDNRFYTDKEGKSYLSYADFAWALVNLLEKGGISQQWISFRQGVE